MQSISVTLNQYESIIVIKTGMATWGNNYLIQQCTNASSNPKTISLSNTLILMKYIVIHDNNNIFKYFYVNSTPIMGYRFAPYNSLYNVGEINKDFFEIDWGNA